LPNPPAVAPLISTAEAAKLLNVSKGTASAGGNRQRLAAF
jgi:hypothetical protein